MTAINNRIKPYANNNFMAQSYASRQHSVARTNEISDASSEKKSSASIKAALSRKTAANGMYYEFRTINAAISVLQYLLAARKSITKTLMRMKNLELSSKPEFCLNKGSYTHQETLKNLSRKWSNLCSGEQIKLPTSIELDEHERGLLKDICNDKIQAVIESFPLAEDPGDEQAYDETHNILKRIDIATQAIAEENSFIKDAIGKLRTASDELSRKAFDRKAIQKRIQNYPYAKAVSNISRKLLTTDRDISLMTQSNILMAEGHMLLN